MNFAETLSLAVSEPRYKTGSKPRSKTGSKPKSRSKTSAKTGSKTAAINSSFSFKAMQLTTNGLLSRGLRWIRTRNLARKSNHHLQLCATVALGEKRFVSVIECDGLRFLIGGGGANVSLLAQLPTSQGTTAAEFNPVHYESAR